MKEQEHLIFKLHGLLYAIDASLVEEVVEMPELRSLATTPRDVIGIFHRQEQIVPVIHLDLRFGRKFKGCRVNDKVILLRWQSGYVGIVASDVVDVAFIASQPIQNGLIYGRSIEGEENFMTGIAQWQGKSIVCLSLFRTVREPDLSAIADEDPDLVTDQEFQLNKLRDRAAKLAQIETNELGNSKTFDFLTVQTGEDYLGLPLESIIDVDTIPRSSLFPIPGALDHLKGQIDWRGEIVPAIEIVPTNNRDRDRPMEIAITKVEDLLIGIVVDRILDTIYLNANEIEPLPVTIDSSYRNYISGITKSPEGHRISLLKLSEQIQQEFLAK
jgi:purine-binding chemotaxis protein CheW